MKCCVLTSTPEERETEASVIVFVCVCVLEDKDKQVFGQSQFDCGPVLSI